MVIIVPMKDSEVLDAAAAEFDIEVLVKGPGGFDP